MRGVLRCRHALTLDVGNAWVQCFAHALSPAQVQQARSDRHVEHSRGDFDHVGFAAFSRGLAVDVGGAIVAATMAPAPVPAVARVLTVAGEMPGPPLFRRHFSLRAPRLKPAPELGEAGFTAN